MANREETILDKVSTPGVGGYRVGGGDSRVKVRQCLYGLRIQVPVLVMAARNGLDMPVFGVLSQLCQ